MVNYCNSADISNRLGFTIGANTLPNTTEVAGMMDDADKRINSEARVTANMTDSFGELKQIAIELVLIMIINMWSFRYPEIFPYTEVELTTEQKRLIHKNQKKFTGGTFDIGG